jgi:hypothetical protein
MKLKSDWSFPVGLIAAWVLASVYTIATLHSMDRDWRSYRAAVSTPHT